MAYYQEAIVKLTNTQLNKLKFAAKNKAVTTLRITEKKFQDEELPHKLFLTTRQETKIRNAFANNMSTHVKLIQAQISTIIQSGRFLGKMLSNLGKNVLLNLAVPLAKDVLPKLATTVISCVLEKLKKKKLEKELQEQEKDSLCLFQMKIWMILLKL